MRTTYGLAALALLAPMAHAAADDSAAIRAQLRQTDAAARQGDLRFVETRAHTQHGKTLDSSSVRIHLQYTGPGTFRTENISTRADQTYTEIYNGDGDFTISRNDPPTNGNVTTEVGISEKPFREPAPYLGPAPVPNYALGRGLSTLQGLGARREGGKIIVTGMLDENTSIRAEVDPEHGYIARSITRHGDTPWTFGPPVQTADGVWVPSWSEYRIRESKGSPGLTDRFVFKGGTFQAPPPEVFRVNLAAFDQIDDNRIEGSPTFFRRPQAVLDRKMYQTPAGVTTAAQLLPYSRKQAAYEADARKNANIPPWERGQAGSGRWLLVWAVAMTAAALVLGWVAWSSHNRRRAA